MVYGSYIAQVFCYSLKAAITQSPASRNRVLAVGNCVSIPQESGQGSYRLLYNVSLQKKDAVIRI